MSDEHPVLHVYGQCAWHDPVMLIATRETLQGLRDACDRLLGACPRGPEAAPHTEIVDAMTSDGEWFHVLLARLDDDWQSGRWQKMTMPYTDEIAEDKRDGSLWPGRFFGAEGE